MDSTTTTIAPQLNSEAARSRPPSVKDTGESQSLREKRDGSDTNKEEEAGEVVVPQEAGDGEYPQGFRLVAIVIALVLSIFLVALDMVHCSLPCILRLVFFANYGSNSRPSSRPPFLVSPISSTALAMSLGMEPRSS